MSCENQQQQQQQQQQREQQQQQQQPSSVPNRSIPIEQRPTTPSQPHSSFHQQQQQQPSSMSILTTGEPRKKRAKIVSACAECRRKKTKCNGEQPCRNCEKSGVQCIYPALMNQHHHLGDRRNNNNTLMNSDGSTAVNKAALESIEQRLQSIEDMLRHLIQYQHQQPRQLLQQWPALGMNDANTANFTPPLRSLARQQQQQQQHLPPLSAPPSTSHPPHTLLNEQPHHPSPLSEKILNAEETDIKVEMTDAAYYSRLPPRNVNSSSTMNTTTTITPTTATTATTTTTAASLSPPPPMSTHSTTSSIQPPFLTTSQPLLPSIRSLSSYTNSHAGIETGVAASSSKTVGGGENSDDSRELPPLFSQSPPNSHTNRAYSH